MYMYSIGKSSSKPSSGSRDSYCLSWIHLQLIFISQGSDSSILRINESDLDKRRWLELQIHIILTVTLWKLFYSHPGSIAAQLSVPSTCQKMCTAQYSPVCGTNHITYCTYILIILLILLMCLNGQNNRLLDDCLRRFFKQFPTSLWLKTIWNERNHFTADKT